MNHHLPDADRNSPVVICSAPGRVNLIGEHTDYNDGLVLPLAIDARTLATVTLRDDQVLSLRSAQRPLEPVSLSLQFLEPGAPSGWAAYVAGALWAARKAGLPLTGLEVALDSDVPPGAGLASSHALQCATLLAVNDLLGWDRTRTQLARLSQSAENDFVGVPTGIMDPLTSFRGRAGHALFVDTRTLAVEQLPFDPAASGLRLVVIDTHIHHTNAGSAYRDRRAQCLSAATQLGVATLRDIAVKDLDAALFDLADDAKRSLVRHVVTENARVLKTRTALQSGDWARVGHLMDASHVSLRDDYQVSCAELDGAVEVAMRTGALGARMTGGGFGGSAIALIPEESYQDLVEQMMDDFRVRRWSAPAIFEVHASAGARVETPPADGDFVR